MTEPRAERTGMALGAPRATTAPIVVQRVAPDGLRLPRVIVFDVNETLSDMSALRDCFEDVGAPAALAATWFASLLRDGFALTITGVNADFADLASACLASMMPTAGVKDVDRAVVRVMETFSTLPLHSDVADGIHGLAALGIRLVTLTNGSAAVAEGLLERSGLSAGFERLLSVQDAPAWKPAPAAYQYALGACTVDPDEAMLVAVHPWDIHGAHRAGLATAFINRTGATYPAYFDRPDVEVASIVELAARLGARAAGSAGTKPSKP